MFKVLFLTLMLMFVGVAQVAPATFFLQNTELRNPIEDCNTFVANVSWYTASVDECGKDDGITASGTVATKGRTIAADDLEFGTKVEINGHVYTVEDRFGGNYRNRIDIYCDSEDEAWENGRKFLTVRILN